MQHTQEAAAIAWFTEFQLHSVIRNGIVPEWFHGVISRKAAEEMLQPKPPGYFLVRVSETRIGYTLSYRADDRCRHFIIEVLRDSQYVILGENTRHPSLQDLVDFHRRVPIMPFKEVLTVACGQVSEDNVDYAELLFRKRAPVQPNQTTLPIDPPSPCNKAHPRTTEETPPALPLRPVATKEQPQSAACADKALPAVPTGGTPRLYPSLDTELFLSTLQPPTLMEPSMKPAQLPRKTHSVMPTSIPADQPPKLPARGCLAHWDLSPSQAPCPTPTRSPRTPRAINLPSKPTCYNGSNPTQAGRGQEGKSAVISNIRKKFQKKRASSQDHMYSEICVEAEERLGPGLGQGRPGAPGAEDRVENKALENEYQELGVQQCGAPPSNSTVALSSPGGSLPPEYLHPPPFAPGY